MSDPETSGRGTSRRRWIHGAEPEKKNTYAYRNIDYDKEIRVLKIYPGEPGEAINCCFVIRSLLDQHDLLDPFKENLRYIPYTALSYCWGVDKPNKIISIFGTDEAYSMYAKSKILGLFVAKFYVKENLYAAFQQFRSPGKDVYLWVDAVCIDQRNMKERTAQVTNMHKVYMYAKDVYIWLGPGKPTENQRTFEFLHKILNFQELELLVNRLKLKKSTWEEDQRDCMNAIKLMKAEWFSRRWIIPPLPPKKSRNEKLTLGDIAEELALATNPSLHQGQCSMPWSDFADAVSLFMTNYDEIRLAFRNPNYYYASPKPNDHHIRALDARAFGANSLVTTINNLFHRSKEGKIERRLLSLETLVSSSMLLEFEASDPKDTVFSILQIAKDTYVEVPSAKTAYSSLKKLSTFLTELPSDGSLPIKNLDKRIEPKYQKCLRDVCADFTAYCIDTSENKSKSLDILCRHWAPKPKPSVYNPIVEMPSWILTTDGNAFGGPKQSHKGRVNGDSLVGVDRKSYTASGNLIPNIKFGTTKAAQEVAEEEPSQMPGEYAKYTIPLTHLEREVPPRYDGTLEIKGVQLGVIEECELVINSIISRQALKVCGWSKEEGCEDLDRLWRILVADRGPDGSKAPGWYRRACASCLYWYENQAEDSFNTNFLKDLEGTPEVEVAFLNRVQRVVWNRRIIRAKASGEPNKWLYGLAPQKSRVGDIICIFYGCSVPVVIRPIEGTKEFKFLGESYVHEMMDGEAVENMNFKNREEWFKLR